MSEPPPKPRAAGWPGRLVELDPHPSDLAPPWAEHIQGIAHAPGQWFVTQADGVWRFPMDRNLADLDADDPDVRRVPVPEAGVNHLGDCDFSDGFLYVPMEGTSPARIGVFDRDLAFCSSAPVAQGDSCPWCTVNPVDGLLYSSPFDTNHLCAYRRRWNQNGRTTLELEHVRDVPLTSEDGARLRLERVQGGAFSPLGHLYLTGDTSDGGLFVFDPVTGRRGLHLVVPYEPGWPEHEVIEGLTVLDLSDGRVPWMQGQLHVLVFDADEDRPDLVWLRHFEAEGAVAPGFELFPDGNKPGMTAARRPPGLPEEEKEDLEDDARRRNPDRTTRREALELELMEEGRSEAGEEIGDEAD